MLAIFDLCANRSKTTDFEKVLLGIVFSIILADSSSKCNTKYFYKGVAWRKATDICHRMNEIA